VKIELIHWPVNEEAPFDFSFHDNIAVKNSTSLTGEELMQLAKNFAPKIVFISGWVDKDYRKVALHFRGKNIPVILGNDNPWKGNWRQKIACMIAPFYVKPYYSHAWVPGKRQYEFVRRLQFSDNNIKLGFYSADINLFKKDASQTRTLPKTILYAGRFLDWKGGRELYQSFQELKEELANDWNLLMIGRGPLKEEFKEDANIEIRDFIQPSALRKIMQNVGVFCLPSYEEHWGVAVHEAAAAGCSIVVSDGVGAGSVFVKHGYNGFVFKSKNKDALKKVLRNMMMTTEKERERMSQNSIKLSEQITPELWAATLMSICN